MVNYIPTQLLLLFREKEERIASENSSVDKAQNLFKRIRMDATSTKAEQQNQNRVRKILRD
jgi:hypothetical protein